MGSDPAGLTPMLWTVAPWRWSRGRDAASPPPNADGQGAMGAVFKLESAQDAASAALNVTASVRGFAWRERLDRVGAGVALAMSQRYRLPELLGRVLAARGV